MGTTAKEEEEETEEKEEENEQMNEQDAEDERNAAVRLLIGEDPVEQVEEKQKDENKEKTLPQVLSTSVNQKLKERNMIRASLAIEEVQRKNKRLEKAKRQRALNIQDEDEYSEDEVAPLPDEE